MNAVVFQIVVLANALLVALPPGWCCQDWAPGEAAKPVAVSCCGARLERPSLPSESPSKPAEAECCCDRNATVSFRNVADKDDLRDAALWLAVAVPEPTQPRIGSPAVVVEQRVYRDAGPPINILNCVWLC